MFPNPINKMIGVINIDREKREIYKDSGGYFYNMKESVDTYVSLKSHIESMQSILDAHPDAELEYDYEAWDDNKSVVVRYKVYVDSGDPRIIKLLEKVRQDEEKMKIKQKEKDKKVLEELKKRSPELFKD